MADATTDLLEATNERIAYHGAISKVMTAERTTLESRLIPVTAYILVAVVECWHRYPDMMRAIDAATPAEEIGAAGRRPGMRVNAVHLWSIANLYLTGRKALSQFGMAEDDVASIGTVLDFWERAALGYHGGTQRQAWDGGLQLRPYGDDVIAELLDGVRPVAGADDITRLRRFSASLTSYLFLLYFDTRVGTGDSGPYPLADERVLLVRDFYQLGEGEYWWSDVARDVPYRNLTAAFVLEGVDLKVNDWGTSITTPEDYFDGLVAFGLFTTDTADRSLQPVPETEMDGVVNEVRKAQAQHYRNVAAMSRREKVACGAYVYFAFLRPFAEVAGVAGDLDWTVPRDCTGPVYEAFEAMEGLDAPPDEGDEPYFASIAGEV